MLLSTAYAVGEYLKVANGKLFFFVFFCTCFVKGESFTFEYTCQYSLLIHPPH